jgi:rubrerythrin
VSLNYSASRSIKDLEVTSVLNALYAVFSFLVPAAVVGTTNSVRTSATTLNNLQAAFDGESNANARYLVFAKRADEEGYGQVASLFRAAAKAEEIHAANHAAAIRQMGGMPVAHIVPTVPTTTRENLRIAIEGETYERDVMYPEFIEVAKREKASAALRSFTFALKVEAVHAVLYRNALENLVKLSGKQHTYYVCPDCGNTLAELSILNCLVCGHPKSGFIAVN